MPQGRPHSSSPIVVAKKSCKGCWRSERNTSHSHAVDFTNFDKYSNMPFLATAPSRKLPWIRAPSLNTANVGRPYTCRRAQSHIFRRSLHRMGLLKVLHRKTSFISSHQRRYYPTAESPQLRIISSCNLLVETLGCKGQNGENRSTRYNSAGICRLLPCTSQPTQVFYQC